MGEPASAERPAEQTAEARLDADGHPLDRPWVDAEGVLHVPAGCDPQWRWWTPEGMSMDHLLTALEVTKTVWRKYSASDYPEELAKLRYPLVSDPE